MPTTITTDSTSSLYQMLFFQRIADIKTYGYNVMTGGVLDAAIYCQWLAELLMCLERHAVPFGVHHLRVLRVFSMGLREFFVG